MTRQCVTVSSGSTATASGVIRACGCPDGIGWTLWLVEDAPAPVDPDAGLWTRWRRRWPTLVGSDGADGVVPWAEVALDALP